MTTEFLYEKSEVLIALAFFVFLALACELGYWLGHSRRITLTESDQTQFTNIQATILGLLALLLGFTFSMALSRFENRKQMVVQEANAIGTAALRSQFLPATYQIEVEEIFNRYVEIRLDSVLNTAQSSPERQQLDAETVQLQVRLWEIASTALLAEPQSLALSLFTQSLNALIDIKSQRDVAVANHVPESVLVELLVFSILAMAVVGYGNGLAGKRNLIPMVVYSVIIVLVILIIIDLDRPQQGLARISQESMIQVQSMLRSRQR